MAMMTPGYNLTLIKAKFPRRKSKLFGKGKLNAMAEHRPSPDLPISSRTQRLYDRPGLKKQSYNACDKHNADAASDKQIKEVYVALLWPIASNSVVLV